MAGDVGRNERLIVTGAAVTDAGERASSAARVAGSQTVHQYGQRVLIADVPPGAEEPVARSVEVAPSPGRMVSTTAALSSDEVAGLDEQETLGMAAFELRASDGYAAVKAARPHADEPWAQPGGDVLPPDILDDADELGAAAGNGQAPAPTSGRLTGSVAVGVIIVDGPTAALKFTAAERTKVVAEVQNGLAWLGAQSSPAGIRWVYDIRPVTITARPQATDTTGAQKEARFRDPALAALGHGAGVSGAQAYVNALRTAKATDWAYCAFFTKYPVGHFAYASIGGPRLVMHYDNDGWGPDNIDRVFAHETGHIFGAPDEYAASGCDCGGQWGPFNVANKNCENCATGGGVPCLMKSNTWAMCEYTPYHLGFPQGARYTGVFLAGSGGHGLWTNASWNPFVAKWQEWSGQGMRLVDFDVAQLGNDFRYSGAFRAGTGGHALWAMADWGSFHQKWQQWSGQGLRLVDIEVTRVGAADRYSGVFLQGSGGHALWAQADWNSFVAKWQQWSGQGLRLVDFDVVMVNGSPRYSGVFRQGSGAYALWAMADWNSFHQKWQQWSGQGLRLVDIERTKVGSETRYSGVFRAGSGGHGLWTGASWTSFRTKWEEWSGSGLRLVDVSLDPTGIELASAQPAGAPATNGAGALGGLLGFGGAPLAPAVVDGYQAPGEGMVDLGSAAGDDGVGVGDVSLTTGAPEVAAPYWLAELEAAAGGNGDQAAAGFGSAALPEADDSRAAGEEHTEGRGAAVLAGLGEGGVPEPAGVGMAHN